MKVKPTYEELEKRVQELEKLESEHKYSKEALQENETLFKMLFEKAPLSYQSLDENGHFLVVNQTWLDTLGYTREEVIGKSFADFLHPDWRDHFKENFPQFKAIGEILGVEFEMVKKNGDLILVSFNGKISRDKTGGFQQTHCIFNDITERKQADEALKISERFLRFTLDGLSAHIAVVDERGEIILTNKTYRDFGELNGIEPSAFSEGTNYLVVCDTASGEHSEEAGPFAEGIREVLSGKLPSFELEYPCHSPEKKRWFVARVTPIQGEGPRRVVIAHENITERKQATEAHRHSNELMQYIVEHTNSAVAVHDRNLRYLYVSDRYLKDYGVQKQDIIGKHHYDVFPDLPKKWREVHRKALAGEVSSSERDPYQRADGTVDWTRWECRPWYKANGSIGGIIVYTEVITEHVQAEEALRESEEKFRLLFKTFPLGITVSDRSGNIIESNSRATEMLGIAKDEHEARRIDGEQWRIFRPDGTPMPVEEWASVRALQENRLVENTEMGIVKPGKEITWINVTAAPLPLENYGVVVIYNDITERKRVEQALQDSEDRFRAIVEGAPDAVFVQTERRFAYLNQQALQLFGAKSRDELLGQPVFDRFHPDYHDKVRERIRQLNDERQPVINSFEQRYLRLDGSEVWVETTAQPIVYQGKSGALVFVRDITARKQAEAEKERLEAQLQQAQKMEAVGRLAGGVAHDFNNMLGVIFGHTEMALEDVDPAAPLYDSLQAIQYATERSAALTRQLLAFARKQTVAPKVVDLNENVAGMLNMLRRLIGEDIDLLWQPGENLPPVKIDPSQIDQLLANLCVNARDAIEGVGKITIETASAAFDEAYCAAHLGFVPGEYTLLAVSDDGCGMDKKILNQIFEPFFTTKELGKGTGLGLASVFGMVKQNNGFINVYSEPGQGTSFKIYLPAYAVKSDGVAEKLPELPTEHGNETILLVEDEPAILQMTTRMLKRLGYTVIAAATPGEAIRLTLEYRGRIHLLMTDVVMPEMNGRELAGNLLSHYPDLKQLFMSGYTANVIAHHGVLDEGVNFIQKPFSMKDLGRKLRETLEG